MTASNEVKGLVSVIIPNYNHSKFLKKRIDSVLEQTYTKIEIILLDDASTDNSLSILEKYKSLEQVTVLDVNKKNSGSPFRQWKKGLEYSRGEYVWIAESDDYNHPEFLQTLIQHHLQYPTIGLAYANSWIVDEFDHVFDKKRYVAREFDEQRWEDSFFSIGKNEVLKYLLYHCTIPNVSCVLFKRQALASKIDLIQSFKAGGDYMIYVSILRDFDLYFEKKYLNYFRTHELTTRGFNKDKIELQMLETIRIKRYIAEHFEIDKKIVDEVIKRDCRRKDFFYDTTSFRLQQLVEKLNHCQNRTGIILAPYNYYTKVIAEKLLKFEYTVHCILDKRYSKTNIFFKKIPVAGYDSLQKKHIDTSVFIIASDRFQDEIFALVQSVAGEDIKVLFF